MVISKSSPLESAIEMATIATGCTIVAISDWSIVNDGDSLAMFLVATVDNGEVLKTAWYFFRVIIS